MIKGCILAKLERSLLSCLLWSHHITAVAANSPAEVTAPRPALHSGLWPGGGAAWVPSEAADSWKPQTEQRTEHLLLGGLGATALLLPPASLGHSAQPGPHSLSKVRLSAGQVAMAWPRPPAQLHRSPEPLAAALRASVCIRGLTQEALPAAGVTSRQTDAQDRPGQRETPGTVRDLPESPGRELTAKGLPGPAP